MLRGSCDGLVDHLLVGRRVQELAAQVLQQAQRPRGHREAAPAAAGAVKHRPHQRQAGTLAGEPADDLGASAGLAEGPLDKVRVPDPVPVLGWEPQVDRERGEVVGDARDRGGVAALSLRRELGRLAAGDSDGLVAGLGVADVEDGPEVGLHLVLVMGGHLGQGVAGAVGPYGNNVPPFVLFFRSDALEVAWRSQRMLACNCRCGLGCSCRTSTSGSGACCWQPRPGCWAMGACVPSPRWPRSARPLSARACWSWTRARGHCRSAAPGGRVVGANGPRTTTQDWCLACWGWWSRTSGATQCRRCGGRPDRCGTWPQSWPGRGMRCRRPRSAGCG